MPQINAGMARYNLDDPEDLAVLVDRGLIWKGGPKAVAKALSAIKRGDVPRPTKNVPPEVSAYLDRMGIPVGGTEDGDPTVPAEPSDLDPEEPPVL